MSGSGVPSTSPHTTESRKPAVNTAVIIHGTDHEDAAGTACFRYCVGIRSVSQLRWQLFWYWRVCLQLDSPKIRIRLQ
jgi:hypothetical protein